MSKKNPNKLYLVGTGPGGLEHLTLAARKALEEAEVIVGYHRYLTLLSPLLKGKEIISAQMTEEIKRAKEALSLASSGLAVALVSGGDPAIYGMSAPVFELLYAEGSPEAEIEIIPGVTAACAAAARLGAPLSTDLVFLSLSDRLTPWETIERRLRLACEGDFVLVIYNPTSRKRKPLLKRAAEILLQEKSPETPVGLVKSVTREGEKKAIFTLKELPRYLDQIDMATILIVGNSQTKIGQDFMLTPRGYGKKYRLRD